MAIPHRMLLLSLLLRLLLHSLTGFLDVSFWHLHGLVVNLTHRRHHSHYLSCNALTMTRSSLSCTSYLFSSPDSFLDQYTMGCFSPSSIWYKHAPTTKSETSVFTTFSHVVFGICRCVILDKAFFRSWNACFCSLFQWNSSVFHVKWVNVTTKGQNRATMPGHKAQGTVVCVQNILDRKHVTAQLAQQVCPVC